MSQNTTPEIKCAHARLVDITELVPNPRNPNKHGDKQVAMLAKIIRHQGWRAPIVVSKRSGFIVTGHGRLEAAKLLQVQAVPVDFQDFASEADEWAHLIADNRIAELAEIDEKELGGLLKELDGQIDLDVTGFDQSEIDEMLPEAVSLESRYTTKIKSPIYEPKGNKPKVGELFNREKTETLIVEIESASLPNEVSQFLKIAAERHTVFMFSQIAEYYCHASKDVQELFEKSGLVIIDFEKAIENGFVHMSEELGKLAEQEEGAEADA